MKTVKKMKIEYENANQTASNTTRPSQINHN
jgi:hypothetical protein